MKMTTRSYKVGDGTKLAQYAAEGKLYFDAGFAGASQLVKVDVSDNKTITIEGRQMTVGAWGCAPGLRLKIAE
jgi:hypothetical protein